MIRDDEKISTAYLAHALKVVYLLKDSVIVDSSAIVHICNNLKQLKDAEEVIKEVFAGSQILTVKKIGIMVINYVDVQGIKRFLHAKDVYFIPSFHTNYVLEDCLNSVRY